MVTAHARPLGRRRLDRSPRDPGTARGHTARALRAGRSPRARRAPGRDHQGRAPARRARVAHWAVILFAVATALTHLGIGKEMVLVAFGITFGGLILALALAFGLGGRHIAADLLRRRLRRESPPPQERLTHL